MLEATTKTVPHPVRWPALLVVGWLSLGAALAASGVLSRAPQVGPLFISGSVILWIALYRARGAVHRWLDDLPLRPLVALHAIRLPIGALFLWEASMNRLPDLFAQRAGIGDIAIGALALLATALVSQRRRWVVAFSIVGLLDILLALGTGMYLMFVASDPLMLGAIARAPYALLPLAIVPSVIVTHLLVLARRRQIPR